VFRHRVLLKYKTNDLVSKCDFVIATASTAVSFAVLHYKPLIFIYDDQILDVFGHTHVYPLILNMAALLGCPLYNIDKIDDGGQIALYKVDVNKYDRYKYDYLVSKSTENKMTGKIFCDYLNAYRH
jgi:hypothetical protein